MSNWRDLIKGKKITVMGLGLLGRGVGDVRFLAEEGADLIVTDMKTREELAPSLEALKDFSNITFVLGEHRLEDFRSRDMILKAAGIPLDSPHIAEARKQGIPVEMSTSFFAAHTEATVIGVTGTRGKSTITHLLFEIVKKYFEEQGRGNMYLGGNVKGVSTLPYLREAKKGDCAVLELDSWQLQGFGDRKISPHISVFSTIFADHLNYYKNDFDAYIADKANIFKYQKPEDYLILGKNAEQYMKEKFGREIVSNLFVADENDVPKDWRVLMPGIHNRYNAGLAVAAARAMNIPDDVIKATVESFKCVPGRLELVREWNGIKIYNDTNATTPDATLAALAALKPAPVVLIMGGADKSLDMAGLINELPTATKSVILLAGSGSTRIESELAAKIPNLQKAASLKEAFDKAISLAEKDDAVLFSPAFASFGLFKNEYDRGDQFNSLVNSL